MSGNVSGSGGEVFRPAAPEESDSLYRLIQLRVDWLEEHRIAQWQRDYYPNLFPRSFFRQKAEEGRLYGIWNADGAPIATAVLLERDEEVWPDGERAIYVHNLAAHPAFPGAGLRLLAQAMDRARSKGMKHLRLDTLQSNGALPAYYKRLGFVQMGTVEAEGYAGYLFQCPCDPGLRLEDADRKKV